MALTIEQIRRRSNKAVCSAMEREISVKKSRVPAVLQTLRRNNMRIIGMSTGEDPVRIWFIGKGGIPLF